MADTTAIMEKLMADAKEIAESQGHKLWPWQQFSVVSVTECQDCSAYVRVEAYFWDSNNPATKDGVTRGSAVSRECSKKK